MQRYSLSCIQLSAAHVLSSSRALRIILNQDTERWYHSPPGVCKIGLLNCLLPEDLGDTRELSLTEPGKCRDKEQADCHFLGIRGRQGAARTPNCLRIPSQGHCGLRLSAAPAVLRNPTPSPLVTGKQESNGEVTCFTCSRAKLQLE